MRKIKKHSRKILLTGIALIAFSFIFSYAYASGNIYYLDPANGKDTNDGSINNPWKTMDKVVTATSAGDTVNIRGGTYVKSQYNKPETVFFEWRTYGGYSLGSPNNPITIQAAPGEKVIFNGEGRTYFMRLNSINNPGYPGHFVIIKDLNFINYRGVALGFGYHDGNIIYGIKNVVIDSCTFKNFTDADTGGVFMSGCENMILRNSTFENMGISSGTMHPIYISEGNKNIVLENNVINGASGFGMHVFGHGDYGRTTENLIIRNNTIINSQSNHILISSTNYNRVYLYNNTLFSTHNPYPPKNNSDVYNHFRFSCDGPKNVFIKNNISYGPLVQGNIDFTSWSETLTSSMAENLPNFHFDYNIWQNTDNTNRFLLDYISSSTSSRSFSYTFEQFKAMSGGSKNSQVIDPLFSDPSKFDLTLKSDSPAINAGDFLTKTLNSGSGKLIVVEDAGYFHDGFNVIDGDTIQVGSQTVKITEIDYANNIITVDSDISWAKGESVSLPYKGSAPDIGAHEYQGDSGNPADLNIDTFVNSTDVQLCVNVILGTETDLAIVARAKAVIPDVPENVCNVLDLQAIVNAILAQ